MKSSPSLPRSRALLRVLVRVPGCLVLACGLVLGAADASVASVDPGNSAPSVDPGNSAPLGSSGAPLASGGSGAPAGWGRLTPYLHRLLPVPPGPDDRGGAALSGSVAPVDTEVARGENGDFTLSVVNAGSVTAGNVRVLLDDGEDGNGVGSADGRCLGRLDPTSPADLWCDLGDLAPQQRVSVEVHAFMSRCVWGDPATSMPWQHAPAFRWRVGYNDGGRSLTVNGPTPRWSCTLARYRADLDTDPAARRP